MGIEWFDNAKFSLDMAKKFSRARKFMKDHNDDDRYGDLKNEYIEAEYEFWDARDYFSEKAESCHVKFTHLLQAAVKMKDFSSPNDWVQELKKFDIGFYPDFALISEMEKEDAC